MAERIRTPPWTRPSTRRAQHEAGFAEDCTVPVRPMHPRRPGAGVWLHGGCCLRKTGTQRAHARARTHLSISLEPGADPNLVLLPWSKPEESANPSLLCVTSCRRCRAATMPRDPLSQPYLQKLWLWRSARFHRPPPSTCPTLRHLSRGRPSALHLAAIPRPPSPGSLHVLLL